MGGTGGRAGTGSWVPASLPCTSEAVRKEKTSHSLCEKGVCVHAYGMSRGRRDAGVSWKHITLRGSRKIFTSFIQQAADGERK